jgi:imidazolonepropionase
MERSTSTFLIRGARQLLTLRGAQAARRGSALSELNIIGDGAVLVRDGVIQEVGPTRRLENVGDARKAVEINAAGRVVMPGFVDSHTHMAYPLGGVFHHGDCGKRAIQNGTVTRLAMKNRAHLESMARHGTTTVEIKTGFGPDESAELKLLRVLQELKSGPIEVVPTFLFCLPGEDLNGAHDAAAEWVFAELLPRIRRRRLAAFADLAWNANPSWHARFSRYLQMSRSLGFACKIHADQRSPGAAVRMALEHLVQSVDHLEHASAADAAQLGQSASMATLLPAAAFHADAPFAPARTLIDRGAAVALASNFNTRHTPGVSMQTVVALACRHMEMTPEEAIGAATINGAFALGVNRRVGSLEIGKSADLLVLNVPDYRDLAHHFGDNLVQLTMKHGAVIYQEGEVTHLAAEQLRLCW